jgi:hypothetical protein
MNLNTRGGGRNLIPVVMGGKGINATRSPFPTNCRARFTPLPDGTAERRVRTHRLRAAHLFLGSQGFVCVHSDVDVAGAAGLSTVKPMAAPIRGVVAANRNRSLKDHSHD